MILILLACSDPATEPLSPDTDTSVEPDTAADTATPLEDPLASADVVIIGAGASGLTAGVVAAAAGASVLLIEREHMLGGSGTFAGNFFAAGTTWQADEGIEDSPEAALADWAEMTNGGDPTHPWVERFVYDSAENLEWLGAYGAAFATLNGDTSGASVRRIHPLQLGGGHPIQAMSELMAEDVWLKTTGLSLVTSGDAVIGVRVEKDDGTTGWIQGGAVVVATGGFARNDDRVYAAVPGLLKLPRNTGSWHGSDGNGLDLIEAAGGTLENMENIGIYGHSVTDANLGSPEIQLLMGGTAGMIVSEGGLRVINEDELSTVWGGRAALEHGQLIRIFDSDMWEDIQMAGYGYNYMPVSEGVLTSTEYAELMPIAKGNTLQALGTALSMDGEVLWQTIVDYNALVDDGKDTALGRDLTDTSAVRNAPFYGVPIAAATGKSFGGAALAEDGSVLGVDGVAIPGLFAAGEVAGVLGGEHIGQGISGSIAGVIYSGRIAGAGAAAYAAASDSK